MSGSLEAKKLRKIARDAKVRTGINQESVKELFDYDPETGFLVWRVNRGVLLTKGLRAGGSSVRGARKVCVSQIRFKEHHIVWLWVYGYIPENDIDHINRDPSDNRLCNLREVSRTCNSRNRRVGVNNTSGVVGVSHDACLKCCRATIKVNGKLKVLYQGKNFDEAVFHRLAAEQCLGWRTCCNKETSAELYVRSLLSTAS